MQERIQKIISAAGITSRRAAEDLIIEGRVRVNGKVVTELGSKADPEKDHIKVDGKLINPQQPKAYLVLNKPVGYVTTMSDPEGRQTVQDLLKGVKVRVYPVGRLDYNTEGLLLLTNDGDFAHLITHPRYELPKTYLVKIKGVLNDEAISRLESGVFLTDGRTAPARVKRLRKEEANSWVEITIHEGKKRQVRRMIDHVGNSVIRLKRVRVGNLPLGNLPPGSYRYLTPEEITALRDLAEGKVGGTREEKVTTAGKREAEGERGRDKAERRVARGGRGKERRTWERVSKGPVAKVQVPGRPERREAAGRMRGREDAETRGRMATGARQGGRGTWARGVTAGPGARVQGHGKTERRETRGEARWTSGERATAGPAGRGRGPGKAQGTKDAERWTSNKPFGMKRKTEGERREGRAGAVRRNASGEKWQRRGAGSQRPNERRKPPAGRPRRPVR